MVKQSWAHKHPILTSFLIVLTIVFVLVSSIISFTIISGTSGTNNKNNEVLTYGSINKFCNEIKYHYARCPVGKPSLDCSNEAVSKVQEDNGLTYDQMTIILEDCFPGLSENNNQNDNTVQTDDNTQTSTPPVKEKSDKATIGEKNALSQALSYLRSIPFSREGLIEQLEYEGFTHEEAVYGVDNCGADWNEQAALKAQSYLDYSPFSREGLIEQLEYEGFTREQAEYGVQAVEYY